MNNAREQLTKPPRFEVGEDKADRQDARKRMCAIGWQWIDHLMNGVDGRGKLYSEDHPLIQFGGFVVDCHTKQGKEQHQDRQSCKHSTVFRHFLAGVSLAPNSLHIPDQGHWRLTLASKEFSAAIFFPSQPLCRSLRFVRHAKSIQSPLR